MEQSQQANSVKTQTKREHLAGAPNRKLLMSHLILLVTIVHTVPNCVNRGRYQRKLSTMKWCVSFPEEEILVVRPSLVAICMGNRPAAKLLGVLLYRYSIRKEHKDDAENMNEVKASRGDKPDQDTTFRIYRRQAQLIKDMCDEITEKTLCDTAVPMLQLLGYLDLDETSLIYCYDVHLETIMQAMEAYKKGQASLEAFFLSHLQLEKVLIDLTLEKVLIGNKKKFLWTLEKVPMPLEKVLITIRKSSNVKRGRKPKPQAPREPQIEKPQISIDCIKTEEESVVVTNTDAQPNSTHTPPAVAGDYENTAPSMQLSTATEQSVDNSHRDNHSQSYSHKPTTSAPTHVGVMPVLTPPMPPVIEGVKMPDAPPSADLDEKKRLGLIAELIRERAPQVSGVTIPVLKFLDAWDREKYGPCALVAWEVSSAKEIVTRHHGTVEDALLLADHLKAKGKDVRLELICGVWNKLSELKKPVPPSYQPKAFNADDLPKDVWA